MHIYAHMYMHYSWHAWRPVVVVARTTRRTLDKRKKEEFLDGNDEEIILY